MKQLKCPECGEISTFVGLYDISGHTYTNININKEGKVDADWSTEFNEHEYYELRDVTCDKCDEEVKLEDITIVETEAA